MSLTVNLDSATAANGTFSAPIRSTTRSARRRLSPPLSPRLAPGAWNYSVTIPAADLTAGGNNVVASGTLTFDANGQLTDPAAGAPSPSRPPDWRTAPTT